MTELNVLLVEDNEVDAERVQRLFSRSQVRHDLQHVEDAQAGLDLLNERVSNGQPLPDIILLDLNLPGLNGLEFLEIVRTNQPTSQIPVCILSSSNWHSDVERATALGITKYFTKPIDVDDVEHLSTLINGSRSAAASDGKSAGVAGE